jgi:hypothetical protein
MSLSLAAETFVMLTGVERKRQSNQRYRRGDRYSKKDHAFLQQIPEVKFRFIQEHRSEFRVKKMCDVLGVAAS